MNNWKAQDQSTLEYFGILEFEVNDNKTVYFEIYKNNCYLVFGNCTNTGLLESGNYKIDDNFSIDENLQELIEDLECFYNNSSTSDAFACNDRM